jgi:hypothetical protein
VIGEDPIYCYVLQLALGVLVEGADADVADPLTVHGRQKCQGRILDLQRGGVRNVEDRSYPDKTGGRGVTS